jgi:undecaprenyl-diphosphatase
MIKSAHAALLRFFSWLGGYEFAVLLAFAGIASGAWLFSFIASEVIQGDTLAFDRSVLLAMRHPGDLLPIGPPAVQESARDITALGGTTALLLITAITSGFLFLDGRRRMALFLWGSIGGGLLLSMGLKMAFHRPRPDIVPYGA